MASPRKIIRLKIADITLDPQNAKKHTDVDVAAIQRSLETFGQQTPIVVDSQNVVIKGNGTTLAAMKLGWTHIEALQTTLSGEQLRAYAIADNRTAELSSWDFDRLAEQLQGFEDQALQLAAGFDEAALAALLKDAQAVLNTPPAAPEGLPGSEGGEPEPEGEPKVPGKKLADRFLIAPFSVLNAREGWWQERKRAWLELGIRSEEGRGDNLLKKSLHERVALVYKGGGAVGSHYQAAKDFVEQKRALGWSDEQILKAAGATGAGDAGERLGAFPANIEAVIPNYYQKLKAGQTREEIIQEWQADGSQTAAGTSVFDPVLCELAYRWFSPPGGVVGDPFSGGSVRGIVAAKLGRRYWGMDLSEDQVQANREQAQAICPEAELSWTAGDSRTILEQDPPEFDFLFSCPPYAFLERYSENPLDLSTMTYEEFLVAYRDIIQKACSRLKMDRFACFVVGEVRDKHGNYLDFVGDTIQAFRDSGLAFYNEAILITPAGTLPIRVSKAFAGSRKLGKTHQNVLVFVKGSPKAAAEAIGECDFADCPLEEAAAQQAQAASQASPYGELVTASSLGGEV